MDDHEWRQRYGVTRRPRGSLPPEVEAARWRILDAMDYPPSIRPKIPPAVVQAARWGEFL